MSCAPLCTSSISPNRAEVSWSQTNQKVTHEHNILKSWLLNFMCAAFSNNTAMNKVKICPEIPSRSTPHRTSFLSLKLPKSLTRSKGEKQRSIIHKLLMELILANDGESIFLAKLSREPVNILYTVIGWKSNRAKLKLLHQIPALRPPWTRDLSAALQVAASGPRGIFNSWSTTKLAAD